MKSSRAARPVVKGGVSREAKLLLQFVTEVAMLVGTRFMAQDLENARCSFEWRALAGGLLVPACAADREGPLACLRSCNLTPSRIQGSLVFVSCCLHNELLVSACISQPDTGQFQDIVHKHMHRVNVEALHCSKRVPGLAVFVSPCSRPCRIRSGSLVVPELMQLM